MNDLRIVTNRDLDHDTVYIDENNKVKAKGGAANGGGSSGVDFSAIPEKPWEAGSKVVAFDRSGQPYKFANSAAYEKDFAVKIHSTEPRKEGENAVYDVTITVTNTRATVADNATLEIRSAHTVSNTQVETTSATITSQDETQINFAQFVGFGTARIKTTVTTPNDTDSYISVGIEVPGDVNQDNNTARANLRKIATPEPPPNEYTQECPEIVVTYDGERLVASKQQFEANGRGAQGYITVSHCNFFPEKQNLNGLSFNLDGASTVLVHGLFMPEYDSLNITYGSPDFVVKELAGNKLKVLTTPHDYSGYMAGATRVLTQDDYTFENGVLTFKETNVLCAKIYMRPSNASCKWQSFNVSALSFETTFTVTENKFVTSNLDESKVRYKTLSIEGAGVTLDWFSPRDRIGAEIKLFPESEGYLRFDFNAIEDDGGSYRVQENIMNALGVLPSDLSTTEVKKTVITLPTGEAFDFFIHAPKGTLAETQGNVAISWDNDEEKYRVVVQNTASATDNVNTYRVSISIV